MSRKVPSETLNVLVLSASLRKDSINGKLAALAAKEAEKAGWSVDHASMQEFDVPHYDGDVETSAGLPQGAEEFKRRLVGSDAFIVASPEYNGAMPGAFKNLIDWTSRFRPQPFDDRHALLLSASPSLAGGNRGLWSLRVPLEHMGTRVFPHMFSLSMAHKTMPADDIEDAVLHARFVKNIQSFLSLAEAAKRYPCMKEDWVEFLGEPPGAGLDRVDVMG